MTTRHAFGGAWVRFTAAPEAMPKSGKKTR